MGWRCHCGAVRSAQRDSIKPAFVSFHRGLLATFFLSGIGLLFAVPLCSQKPGSLEPLSCQNDPRFGHCCGVFPESACFSLRI